MSLWEMLLRMFSTDHYKTLHEVPVVLLGVYGYLVTTAIFLFNLFIAQLKCSYDSRQVYWLSSGCFLFYRPNHGRFQSSFLSARGVARGRHLFVQLESN